MIFRLARPLGKRVAWRLFVLFVVCALLPLAAIAALSFSQVRMLLLQQGDHRLTATAKSYGMTLFERLLLAAEIGASAVEGASPTGSMSTRAFRSLSLMDEEGLVRAIHGDADVSAFSAQHLQRLRSGKPVVRVTGGNAQPRIELAAPLAHPARGWIVGELEPGFLWGPADELPAATNFCVLEDRWRTILYCSAPMPETVLRGANEYRSDGAPQRAQGWTQFMRAGFGTPDWIVVAAQPESYHLARAVEFSRLYMPVVALALLLVLWLTIRQSRNIVRPVEQLAERARAIARNEFGGRLDLKREDEFGELATAFDNMSERLGLQITSLTALAEIDRLILSTQDISQVVRKVLQHLREAVVAESITVTLLDREHPDHARTYYLEAPDDESASMVRHPVGGEESERLAADPTPRWVPLEPDARHAGHLELARSQGMHWAFVQPVAWRGQLCGAIVVGRRRNSQPGDDERRRIAEIADRVAVAVSSAWRDQQLYVQSHFDVVTGAPNRLLFRDRLGLEIVRSRREGLVFALLFIDLDHFKNVNDSFGHTMGDAVLRESAARIGRCIRASDTVARLGGDEFTVMLTNLATAQEAWLIAETVVESLSREFVMGEQRCFLSASVGIASYPADGRTEEELLKSADTAMYRAKAGGRSQVVFFEERMNEEAVARVSLDRDLRVAIERGELVLHYQPQQDLRTGQILGVEALVRWIHPQKGLISPARFIPLAEESGYIEQVGQWTLREACAQMSRWRAAGVPLEHVSVNVSPRQFRKRGLVDFIQSCIDELGLPPECLQVEITEGLLLDRGEAVEGMLHDLARRGHGIALDDFGTGFSSMAYLKRFPVHTIKIDRVFVDGLDRSSDSEPIVAAIIAMSHALGKSVVAEGAETDEQVAILRRLGCDRVQGFRLAPALPPEEIARLVREQGMVPA